MIELNVLLIAGVVLGPAMHYSVSREDYIVGHRTDVKPDFQDLLTQGYKKAKLRRIPITCGIQP